MTYNALVTVLQRQVHARLEALPLSLSARFSLCSDTL
jgi:hypothetical protein